MNFKQKFLLIALISIAIFSFEHIVLAVSSSTIISIEITTGCDPHGDINNDGRIDIVDFSILMYFWGQENPSNPCADINRDGVVNITDFSIMLYWWTG